MLMGIKMRAYPTSEQSKMLSQWIGCSRVVWNAKCDEWKYESTFAKKYLSIGSYAQVDQTYSQYKDKELTPYLSEVPSQILRNSVTNWYETMRNWMNPKHPQNSPAKKKKKKSEESVCLTNELFEFVKDSNGSMRLHIGTKKYPVGELRFVAHRDFTLPKSIRIKRKSSSWYVSFCYDDFLTEDEILSEEDTLDKFRNLDEKDLENCVVGVDRGVAVACQTDSSSFDLTSREKLKRSMRDRYIKRYQRTLSRQVKGSNQREKTKKRISKIHNKNKNVRENFCHQTSHALTKDPEKVIVMEDLKTSQMTRRPKPKKNEETGKWESNKAAQKAGLNKSILAVGWYKLEQYTKYKARRRGSILIKISPQFSSQECADCGHIHSDNRVSQAVFACQACGHRDNADHNAAVVLKKRAIKLIKDPGTGLSAKGVLSRADMGCGANSKTSAKSSRTRGRRSIKKDEVLSSEALAL